MAARRVAFVLGLFLPFAALADGPEDALARGDYAVAREGLRAAAEAGDASAWFQLGTLADLGLGEPRDPARALRLYMQAADHGVSEAQFNVAVMLDGGVVGTARPEAAAVWYARAAANGMDRARYNLGQAYAQGRGVPRNVDAARYWLGVSSLGAAAEARAALPPTQSAAALVAPGPSGGYRAGDHVELVWTMPPSAGRAAVTVQVVDLNSGDELHRLTTAASAVSLPVPADAGPIAWRVLRLSEDGSRYAGTEWSRVDAGGDGTALYAGRVVFEVGSSDADARRLAETLSADLTPNGVIATVATAPSAPDRSTVLYGTATDETAARAIAAIVPAFDADRIELSSDVPPGDVVVALAGGLTP